MIRDELNTFAIGVGVALMLHAVGILAFRSVKWEGEPAYQSVVIHIENADIAVHDSDTALGIESVSSSDMQQSKVADKKRQIYQQYLADISDCVHAHRFLLSGSRDLIGIASITFQIESDGTFSAVKLRSSSGRELLDRSAAEAVRACSGKVKRPPSTGLHPLVVLQEVRYQFKL